MKKQRSQSKRRRSQKRKINRFRLFVVLSLVNVLLLIFTVVLLPSALNKPQDGEGKPSALGVRSVTVEGNTVYDNEAIVQVSGIKVGQNVFSINKGQAVKNIKKEFAYAKDVAVKVSIRREVTIRITQAKELGAVYASGGWVVVDENGKGLQKLPIESERPLRRLYLKGAGTLTDKVGKQVLDDRSLAIASELCRALEDYEFSGVGEIDMTNRNDIRVNWKNQIIIALGNDSNLSYEIAVAATAVPKILARHGESASGVLNVSQYSDSSIETPSVIFTPSDLLDTTQKSHGEKPETE